MTQQWRCQCLWWKHCNRHLQINFFLNGNPVQQSDRVKCQYENGFALLSIDEVSEKDAGYYVFQAENDIGQAETSATVVIVPRMDSSMYLAESETAIVDVEDMRELQVPSTNSIASKQICTGFSNSWPNACTAIHTTTSWLPLWRRTWPFLFWCPYRSRQWSNVACDLAQRWTAIAECQ